LLKKELLFWAGRCSKT